MNTSWVNVPLRISVRLPGCDRIGCRVRHVVVVNFVMLIQRSHVDGAFKAKN